MLNNVFNSSEKANTTTLNGYVGLQRVNNTFCNVNLSWELCEIKIQTIINLH